MDAYKIRFKALSPIHIGYGRRLGIINQTRYYITGKSMWGAVTAQLARKVMSSYSATIYIDVGDFVRKQLIVTNFYPIIKGQLCHPRFTDKGFFYGDKPNQSFSKYEFESKVLDSYTSTALQLKSAEEGSLHEIEFLKCKIDGDDVLFEGYLLSNGGFDGKDIHYSGNQYPIVDVLTRVEVGGERKYGFGRLEFIDIAREKSIWECKIEADKIVLPAQTYTPFHIQLTDMLCFIGDIEPLVGREWEAQHSSKTGSGQKVSSSGICVIPGSQIVNETTCYLQAYGIAVID